MYVVQMLFRMRVYSAGLIDVLLCVYQRIGCIRQMLKRNFSPAHYRQLFLSAVDAKFIVCLCCCSVRSCGIYTLENILMMSYFFFKFVGIGKVSKGTKLLIMQ